MATLVSDGGGDRSRRVTHRLHPPILPLMDDHCRSHLYLKNSAVQRTPADGGILGFNILQLEACLYILFRVTRPARGASTADRVSAARPCGVMSCGGCLMVMALKEEDVALWRCLSAGESTVIRVPLREGGWERRVPLEEQRLS